ncbi:MAG: phosphatidylserine decarboxylase [Acidobacteria bacterium]|nr:phosphatidylserine decarboxylase [Acidobacteriota bacterium]MCY3964415.1 phosphatidylserine decarboxylase [Acidobacteriota bacterium]MCY3970947.1 phosphatidylserine decarboxylase [Acidobacteriota bacterium]
MKFAREAWPFVLPFLVAAGVFWLVGILLAAVSMTVLGLLVLLFFRDPTREYDGPPDVVLAPAEGTVTAVEVITDSALGDQTWRRISIFLSVFNVHTQKTPVEGVVIGSIATPGRKLPAYRKEAGDLNENHLTLLRRTDGDLIAVRQIAGLVARRVVSRLQAGQRVIQGEPLGLIKFGSRVDVFVPMSYDPLVEKGQRVISGETPLAMPTDPSTPPPGDFPVKRPPARSSDAR